MEQWEIDALVDESRLNYGSMYPTLDDYSNALHPPPKKRKKRKPRRPPSARQKRLRRIRIASVLFLSIIAAIFSTTFPKDSVIQRMLNTVVGTQVTTITVCTTGCDFPNSNLQGALNAATSSTSGGFVILLESQHTYAGTFVLGDKCGNNTTWDCVTVRTGVTATGTVMSTSLFPGATDLVTVQNAALFAKIVPTVNNASGMRTVYPSETGSACTVVTCRADGWTVKWLEFAPKIDSANKALLRFGIDRPAGDSELPSGNAQDQLSEIPGHLSAIQNYIHGDAFIGQHQGLMLSSAETRVYYNFIDNIKSMTETQAIISLHGTGPYDIQHNMINGVTENFMHGGGDPFYRITATVTGTPTTTTMQLANATYEHVDGTAGTAGLTACTTWPCDDAHSIYSGIYVSLLHAGVEYGMIKCTYSGSTCTFPALSFTPSVGDTVRWSWGMGGLTFKYNWLLKRPEWFTEILPAPTGTTVTSVAGGSLTGSNCYRVVARAFVSGATVGSPIRSRAATEVCTTITGTAHIAWDAVPNATTYRIYGRTSGGQTMYWTVNAPTTTFDDSGVAGTTGTPNATGDTWPAKNNFELKGADGGAPQGVNLIEGNIIDYSVCCDQSNIVSIKTNNQNGKDVSAVIRNLTFQNNWVRHANRGIALTCTSTGNSAPVQASGIMENVVIQNNLFTDLSTSWVKANNTGTVSNSAISITSGGYVNTVKSRGCIDVQFKHNTLLADTDGLNGPMDILINTTTDKHVNLVVKNNIMARDCLTAGCTSAARNSLKGFNPNNAGEGATGWTATTTGTTDASFNAWPGGTVTDYTAAVFPNSFFPSDATLKGYLNNYATCKDATDITGCALSGATPLDNAASDSTDVGANVTAIKAFTDVIAASATGGGGGGGGATPPTFLSKMDSNVDNTATSVTTNAGTISGTNKWIGCIYAFNSLANSGTAVTINDTGETLTKIATVDHDNGGGSVIRNEFWEKTAPGDSTGTTTITGTNGASSAGKSLSCVVYTGVNQTTPHVTLVSAHGNSVTASVSQVVDTTNKLVIDFLAMRTSSAFTAGTGQTQRVQRIGTNPGNASTGISEKAGASSVTSSWSSDDAASKTWAHIAIGLNGTGGPTNTAPSVNAGTDLSVPFLGLASLNGTVTDDGLPSNTLTYSWTKFSGPGTVTFTDSTAVDTTASFSVSGTYVLRLTASDTALSASDDVQVIVGSATTDFTVQAEDFDIGGEGTGYHDLDAANLGGAYRPSEGVDIEATSDTGGGYNVGWAGAGEWLQYTVTTTTTGTYTLSFRVSSNAAGGTFHMDIDGVNATGTMTIPATGGWQTWTTLTKTNVSIASGTRVFKLNMDTNGANGTSVGNFNYISVALASTNSPPSVDVGADLSTTLPAGVALIATATDDGPSSALTFQWTQTSGPGTATFENEIQEDTTATFSTSGTYVLRLTVSDGQLSGFDELTVTVNPAPIVQNTLRADRFMLNQGQCAIRSGSGPPGAIGGCDVYVDNTTGRIYGQSARLSAVASSGDLTFDAASKLVVPSFNYDQSLGSQFKKFLSVYAGELRVDTLVAQDVIATIGGRVLVAPTTTLTQDMDPSSTTITVKHNSIVSGNRLRFEARGQLEYMGVVSGASGTGPYTYTVTRNLDGTGANSWISGDAVVDTGQAGSGFIDLYAKSSLKSTSEIGPTIVGNVRNSLTFNDWAPRWAIGNLNGLYSLGVNTYGAAFGDPNGAWIVVEPIFGLRMGYGAGGSGGGLVSISSSGNASFAGAITATSGTFSGSVNVGTGGVLRSGSTAFLSGTGFWLAFNGGSPQFHVGNPSANYLSFNSATGELKANMNNLSISNQGVNIGIGANSRSNDRGFTFTGGPQWLGMYANTIWSNQGSLELIAEATTNNNNENDAVIIRGKTNDAESYVRVEASENQYNPVFDRGAVWILSSSEEIFMTPGTTAGLTLDAYFENSGQSAGWGTNWHNLKVLGSDERLKTNIQPLAYGLQELRKVQPIRFTWKSTGIESIGFSAQNVLAAGIPEATPLTSNGYYGFSSLSVLATVVNAIREIDAKTSELERRLAIIESKQK